jgi:hypothetical protein
MRKYTERIYRCVQRPSDAKIPDFEHITTIGVRDENVGSLEVSALTIIVHSINCAEYELGRRNRWGPVEHVSVMNVLQTYGEKLLSPA